MLWSPHSHDEAVEALLPLVDVILIDTDDPVYFDGPGAALARAADLLDVERRRRRPRLAAHDRLARAAGRQLLGPDAGRPAGQRCKRIYVRHHHGSIVSALLLDRLAGLAARLGAERARAGTRRRPPWRPPCAAGGGPSVSIEFDPVAQSIRGLAGVTVTGSCRLLAVTRPRAGRA